MRVRLTYGKEGLWVYLPNQNVTVVELDNCRHCRMRNRPYSSSGTTPRDPGRHCMATQGLDSVLFTL